jgi:hypothetical protein
MFQVGDEVVYTNPGAAKKYVSTFRGVVIKLFPTHARVRLSLENGKTVEKLVSLRTLRLFQ